MNRNYSISSKIENCIHEGLASHKLTLDSSKELAQSVLRLSDYFIQNPDKSTPWNESWAQIAYLCYYLPLNMARMKSVATEAHNRGFFSGLERVVDFGAGLATASLVLAEEKNFHFTLVEKANQPAEIIRQHFLHFQKTDWLKSITGQELLQPTKTMAVFSYSLTELKELPAWAEQCEAVMILEPSTQQDGRKLLELRQKLLEKGFHVWAPCTHEGACPLLSQSKTDWCHDRIHFQAPNWFLKLEENLPMRNRTLTMSYLLMRKTKPPTLAAARIVGDRLKEKGKDRQLICRGSDREFLAWLHKNDLRQEIPRGVLVELPGDTPKVSNELRLNQELKIIS